MRVRRVGRVAVVAALAGALVAAGCTSKRGADPAPDGTTVAGQGSPGLGDPYFPRYGNGGYDVANYRIRVRYDPATDQLTGAVVVEAKATADLSRFNLDFVAGGLNVDTAKVDGAAAGHEHEQNELIITPAEPIARGATFTVDIAYGGRPGAVSRPQLGATGFLHTEDGAFAVGEPESASTWFPVNDHPLDKAGYTIEVTAPERLATISNGVLAGSSTKDGWRTTTWQVSSPMASYLTTLAIGNYRVKSGTHRGRPMLTAIAASLPAGGAAERSIERTGEIADFLETRFGPYPFEAYGGIVIDDERIRFALETQTRPMYAATFFRNGESTNVVAHELAHQWFGDSVSVHHWQDIWLNEGFATYAQWMWSEHTGQATTQELFDREYSDSTSDVWQIPPADPGRDNIFSRSVYQRGAMALHALRTAVGDDAFFRILKTWAAEKRNSNATTIEFLSVAERVSGRQLRPLFDAWLYGLSRPAL